jgi:hypothetical protein
MTGPYLMGCRERAFIRPIPTLDGIATKGVNSSHARVLRQPVRKCVMVFPGGAKLRQTVRMKPARARERILEGR